MISGVSGTVSHSTTLSVMVNPVPKPDFSIGPSGVNIGLAQGASTFQPISLTSLGGFTGTVSLTDSVSPSFDATWLLLYRHYRNQWVDISLDHGFSDCLLEPA